MELEEYLEKMTEGSFYKHLADRVKDSDVTSKPKFKKKDEVLRRKTTTTIQDELELQISYGVRQIVNTEREHRRSSHLTKHSTPARGKNLIRQKNSLGTCIPFDIKF